MSQRYLLGAIYGNILCESIRLKSDNGMPRKLPEQLKRKEITPRIKLPKWKYRKGVNLKKKSQKNKLPPHFIKCISLRNFPSIDRIDLNDCGRVNIFIGENNSGKSNIIRGIIGYINPENFPRQKRDIFFYGEHPINTSLNDNKNKHPFFEIPPFRNLIAQNDYPISDDNPKSGIIDLSKIEKVEANFYKHLENIIGIKGFRLKKGPPANFPCCLVRTDNNEQRKIINLEQLTNWGKYQFIHQRVKKNTEIDLLGWGTKSIIVIYYNLYFSSKSSSKAIALIEEPEISTHPKLLKNLLDWAFKYRPKIQFFITTHSSLLIDKIFTGLPDGDLKVFNVYKDGNEWTRVKPLETKTENFKVLDQLGFKSSNLLFTNYVIWVEGPSDIFYYEAFLNMECFIGNHSIPIERGTHYAIMWYGGSEETHLIDIESDDKEDLSILFSFIRSGAIFWDSDGKNKLNEKRKDIVKWKTMMNGKFGEDNFTVGCTGEIVADDGLYSTSKKRPTTIENIMPKTLAKKVIKEVHPRKFLNKEIKEITSALSENKKIPQKYRKKIKKIKLGEKFLEIVNDIIHNKDRNEIESIYTQNKLLGNNLKTFFKNLYEKIEKANNI